MARGIIYVETRPVSPDREAEYHKWYNDTHLAEICSVDGIVSARRFAPTDGNGPFIAIYELDCDDLDAAVQRLGGLGRSGKMSSTGTRSHGDPSRSRRCTARSGHSRHDTFGRRPAAHLRVDGVDEGGRRPAVQGHRHR